MTKRLFWFHLLLLACSTFRLSGQSKRALLQDLSRSYEDLVDQVEPSVVQIVTLGFTSSPDDSALLRTGRGRGSGVIVDAEGYIVTNAHVIGNARRIEVLLPQTNQDREKYRSILKPYGKLVPAEVVGLDRQTDIAVLKVAATGLPVLPFADSDAVRQGQLVFAFGSPFGLEQSVSTGIVSSVARQMRPDDPVIYIQTDAAINPGNSGGPLANHAGEIVGLNTFILSSSGGNQGVGFAVPSNIVKSVYEQIKQFQRVRRGQIGVSVRTIDPEFAAAMNLDRDSGVMIADLAPGGMAEVAGLKIRDLVLSVNGKAMENGRQFGVTIFQNVNKTVSLEILRGKEKLLKLVPITEREKDPERILGMVQGQTNAVRALGILAVDLSDAAKAMLPALRNSSGVVVAGITADLSLEELGFQPGDVVHEVANRPVESLARLKEVCATLTHGQKVVVQLERGGQFQFLMVEID
jgi:serine protease Do